VAEVAKRFTVILGRQVGHQVRPVVVGRDQFGPEAGVPQVAGEELDCRALVAGRVDRVEADQLTQDVGGLPLKVVCGHAAGRVPVRTRSITARDRA